MNADQENQNLTTEAPIRLLRLAQSLRAGYGTHGEQPRSGKGKTLPLINTDNTDQEEGESAKPTAEGVTDLVNG
jgi:hypothetical protein